MLARRGSYAEAEVLGLEAVSLADGGDDPVLKAEARTALAEVLELAGKRAEAEKALELALELFEAKGHVTGADEVRRRLEARYGTRRPVNARGTEPEPSDRLFRIVRGGGARGFGARLHAR